MTACMTAVTAYLHLPPGDRLQAGVRDLEGGVVEAFDVPELKHVVQHHQQSGEPEQAADQDEHLQVSDNMINRLGVDIIILGSG